MHPQSKGLTCCGFGAQLSQLGGCPPHHIVLRGFWVMSGLLKVIKPCMPHHQPVVLRAQLLHAAVQLHGAQRGELSACTPPGAQGSEGGGPAGQAGVGLCSVLVETCNGCMQPVATTEALSVEAVF
jgi:hypothetical protein